MLLPASSEFVQLCRAQVALVIQGFGADRSAVYLTEQVEGAEDANLNPLVIYPDDAQDWSHAINWQIAGMTPPLRSSPQMLTQADGTDEHHHDANHHPDSEPELPPPVAPPSQGSLLVLPGRNPHQSQPPEEGDSAQQLILPLMHETMVVGILMVSRQNDPWTLWEQTQLDQIAQTLSLACALDQRSQWLSHTGYQRRLLQSQEHDTLSTLLHQFRNPLTALRTLGKLMLKRLQPGEANRDLAESIVQQSDRLESLLQEFDQTIDLGEAALADLDDPPASAIPSKPAALPPAVGILSGAELQLQPCWLAEVLHPLIQATHGQIEDHRLTLQTHLPKDFPPVQGNPVALAEVFSNLIDNAIKYTPEGGTVRVSLERTQAFPPPPSTDGHWQQIVSISDSGLGIPSVDLSRIFERNYRGIQAEGEIPGTGLGLAIARELMTKMNGTITATSPTVSPLGDGSLGPGSTLTVCLPEKEH
jgi:signal transduction histidine kinase